MQMNTNGYNKLHPNPNFQSRVYKHDSYNTMMLTTDSKQALQSQNPNYANAWLIY